MTHLHPTVLNSTAIDTSRHWSLNQDLPAAPDDTLVSSITRFSILHPPIVRQSPSDTARYEVICGCRRIAVKKQQETEQHLSCLVLEGDYDTSDIVALIAEDQKHTGPLSPIQTARLIKMAAGDDDKPDRALGAELTGLHNQHKRHQLVQLLDLEEAIRSSIHRGACAVTTGLFLLELAEEDRLLLFAIMTKLSLNTNKQRRFIEMCRIIAANRQYSIADIFRNDYPELIDRPVDNAPQKSAGLMKELHAASHPLSTRAEAEFAEQVKKINLPNNCRVRHSPAFEQDTVTLEIDFSRLDDLKNRWRAIVQELPG